MKFSLKTLSLHGLRVQVLLWTILPLTILLIVFSLTGISSHHNSMHALAVEEKTKLVVTLARTIAVQLESHAFRSQTDPEQVPVSALGLDQLLDIEHSGTPITVALLDQDEEVLYSRNPLPTGESIGSWPGVSEAQSGDSGALFASEFNDDVIAYAPVPGTNWVLIIREPWHSLTVPLLRFEQVLPFVLFGAVIISFLTLFFGIHSVVRPLQAVGVQARRIGAGDFSAAAESVGGVQEIENLRQILDQTAHQLQQHQAALQDYLRAVTQAQEEERSRLSRELHDETVQTLIALGHKAQRVQRSLERDPTQTAGHVNELRQMIAGAVEEVRRFSKSLRPLYLEELGLIPALEMLARDSGASFQVNGPQQRLKAEQELVLYRIAQEALHNALRHAQATNTQVDFQFSKKEVKLRVCDNGVGFETPACFTRLAQTGHFGLMGMHERAQLVNGRLNVISSLGSGTTVVFTVTA